MPALTQLIYSHESPISRDLSNCCHCLTEPAWISRAGGSKGGEVRADRLGRAYAGAGAGSGNVSPGVDLCAGHRARWPSCLCDGVRSCRA